MWSLPSPLPVTRVKLWLCAKAGDGLIFGRKRVWSGFRVMLVSGAVDVDTGGRGCAAALYLLNLLTKPCSTLYCRQAAMNMGSLDSELFSCTHAFHSSVDMVRGNSSFRMNCSKSASIPVSFATNRGSHDMDGAEPGLCICSDG